ncbi:MULTISPECIES: cell division protein FtsQ/DivIB [Selenomonas]|uniref:cell division protein FtsQ/DivIB n=1 Tax=Selenomonas TaxID=970 RepID=UPI0001E0A7AF|nr:MULTISPECIES: FtsQ-type POTRA domain-containing protein [Selenomonas]MBF1688072.1 FtsQ-type POTRA domain-containing protein [Selenomonas sp.]AKT54180.1 ATPase [Selenomonas sp. oral taxon 478]AME03090.1 ATPase [Selenomonas sp. oral taxon 136]EFM23245.1 POTRA domain protein, FtsQ-type [Selenomonas sp. oral taxon 149 str. 67H29BP]MBF1706554.1 FtsQ-type POTRA domain-containing protein [Selenomonas sp.]
MSSRRILRGAFYLLCASGIIAVLVYSPLFTFQQLVVHGNVHLDENELCEIARIHYGQRLFELKTDEMTTNLLRDLRIESAVVRRQLPHKIEMDIVERIPVATVACDYGYLDFDRQGKVIASYRSLKGADIPIITGVKLRDLYIGDDNNDPQVAQAISFLARIDPADIGEISEVSLRNPDAVVAYTKTALPIRLGQLTGIPDKAALTQDFLRDQKTTRHTVEYVDFSYDAPFIKLADKTAEGK